MDRMAFAISCFQPGTFLMGCIHPETFYQKIMADAKYLIRRDEFLPARESEEALQGLRPPALDFLPILMKYTLSR